MAVLGLILSPIVTAESQQAAQPITVTVIADGQTWEWVTSQKTVGGVLSEAGVTLGVKDIVYPKLSTKAGQGMKIRIVRVTEKIIVAKEPIKFQTITKFDFYGGGGRKVIQAGVPGEKEIKYLVTYKDGVKTGTKALGSWVAKKPVSEITSVTKNYVLASRAGKYMRSYKMVATAYAPFVCGGSKSGHTATGVMAGYGIAAVDPRVIPLGTKLYVEGYGLCTAADTGGAIKGAKIDLCYNTYRECIRFGRRTVTVYILD